MRLRREGGLEHISSAAQAAIGGMMAAATPDQWASSTGTVASVTMWRVAPPKIIWRRRL